MIIPDRIVPLRNEIRDDVSPIFTPREENIVKVLSACGATLRSSLESFWSSQAKGWKPMAKGQKKINALLHFGVFWSYMMGDTEIVTLSPMARRAFGGVMYVPEDPRDALRTVLAAELYLRVLRNVPCEFEPADHPAFQGTLTAKGSPAGILVVLRGNNNYLGVKTRCLVICEDAMHIQELSRLFKFPALYVTQGDLFDGGNDISHAFFSCNDGIMERRTIGSFTREDSSQLSAQG